MGIPVYWSLPTPSKIQTRLKPTLKHTRPLPSSIRRSYNRRPGPSYSEVLRRYPPDPLPMGWRQGPAERPTTSAGARRPPGVTPNTFDPVSLDDVWEWGDGERRRPAPIPEPTESSESSQTSLHTWEPFFPEQSIRGSPPPFSDSSEATSVYEYNPELTERSRERGLSEERERILEGERRVFRLYREEERRGEAEVSSPSISSDEEMGPTLPTLVEQAMQEPENAVAGRAVGKVDHICLSILNSVGVLA